MALHSVSHGFLLLVGCLLEQHECAICKQSKGRRPFVSPEISATLLASRMVVPKFESFFLALVQALGGDAAHF